MDDVKATSVIEKLKVADAGEADLIRLSTGVVLRGKKVSASLLIEVLTSVKRPKPPVYRNEKMGRMMENPDDPDYIEQVQAYKYEQAGVMQTMMVLMGTKIASIPAGMEGPHPVKGDKKQKAGGKQKADEWPKWLGEYELLGLPMNPESEAWRYLTWVKFKAAVSDDDLKQIQEVVGRLSGIRENDARAAEEFPGGDQKDR